MCSFVSASTVTSFATCFDFPSFPSVVVSDFLFQTLLACLNYLPEVWPAGFILAGTDMHISNVSSHTTLSLFAWLRACLCDFKIEQQKRHWMFVRQNRRESFGQVFFIDTLLSANSLEIGLNEEIHCRGVMRGLWVMLKQPFVIFRLSRLQRTNSWYWIWPLLCARSQRHNTVKNCHKTSKSRDKQYYYLHYGEWAG